MGSNILVLEMKSSFLVTYLILGISLSCAEDFSFDKALTKLDITPDVFEKLVNGSRNVKRDTITNLLRKQLHKQGLILDVTPAEVRLSQSLPNQCQDTTSCGCRVESRDVQVFAAIQRTSNLTTSGKAFEDAGIVIEAIIDAELGASGNIRAKGTLGDLKDIMLTKAFNTLKSNAQNLETSCEESYQENQQRADRKTLDEVTASKCITRIA